MFFYILIMHIPSVIFASLLLIVSFVQPIYSHGVGASFEKEAGEYVIDIGYEPEWFTEGDTSTFSFQLLTNDTKDPVEFDDIWVRIARGTQTVFATGINSNANNASTMLFTFPQEGDYTLHVRFQKEEEEIVETSFPIRVTPSEKSLITQERIGLLFLGMVVGALSVFAFALIRNKSKKEKSHREVEKG